MKTGTTTFNDMYFHMDAAAKAVKEMGLRAFLAEGIVDLNDPERAAKQLQTAEAVNRRIEAMKTDRISPVLGPHAIYSVSKDTLVRIREVAGKSGSLIHELPEPDESWEEHTMELQSPTILVARQAHAKKQE